MIPMPHSFRGRALRPGGRVHQARGDRRARRRVGDRRLLLAGTSRNLRGDADPGKAPAADRPGRRREEELQPLRRALAAGEVAPPTWPTSTTARQRPKTSEYYARVVREGDPAPADRRLHRDPVQRGRRLGELDGFLDEVEIKILTATRARSGAADASKCGDTSRRRSWTRSRNGLDGSTVGPAPSPGRPRASTAWTAPPEEGFQTGMARDHRGPKPEAEKNGARAADGDQRRPQRRLGPDLQHGDDPGGARRACSGPRRWRQFAVGPGR